MKKTIKKGQSNQVVKPVESAIAESAVVKKAKHIARLSDHARFDRLLAMVKWSTMVTGKNVVAAIEKANKTNHLLVTGDSKCTPFGHLKMTGDYVASTSLIDEWLLEQVKKGNKNNCLWYGKKATR